MKQTKITVAFLIATAMLLMVGCGGATPASVAQETGNPSGLVISEDLPASGQPTTVSVEPEAREPDESDEPLVPQADELGRQAAEDFLGEYLSLFSFGFVSYDGTYRDFSMNEFSMRPLVTWQQINYYPWNVYYDRLGNRIEEAPFLHDGGFAVSFALYDLDDDDMPLIVIRWGIPQTCAALREVWRFVEGEYRNVGMLKGWYSLFYDDAGRLVVLYDDEMSGPMGYYFLTFTEDGIKHEAIAATDNMTPVYRMTELEDEIAESVRRRHGVWHEHGILIGLATDETLSRFEELHEVDYSLVTEALGWYIDSNIVGTRLVVWANSLLRDVALISVGHDIIEHELWFMPIESFGTVSELPPGYAFVINSYVGGGTMPWSGISLVDENGTRRYFAIVPDVRGYVFDPPFLLMEFENRMDELPEDWQPWWQA